MLLVSAETKLGILRNEVQIQNRPKRPFLVRSHAKAATVAPPKCADPETCGSP